MVYLQSSLFNQFPEIIFGLSTKIGLYRKAPFYFNMSHSVGDEKKVVDENKEAFFKELKLLPQNVRRQKQIHSDIVCTVENAGCVEESDALITAKKNVGLAVSTADCTPIFIFDKSKKVIAAIHSGWKGTQLKIVDKTLHKLFSEFGCKPADLICYIAPSISQKNYEVGAEFGGLFSGKYLIERNGKYLLNVSQINYDILVSNHIPLKNIQASNLCSFENDQLFHSYRRDGQKSGRAFGVIAMRGNI
ncbi:MAG: peptidoglycan editing factor PgeF [Bacteroidetes bacterium]|nr:peptidoglycan editing factor PgeF [Bacteroidota bacterium]MBU1680650.1 peptidoglycan editing factor PgeF [Bacteroidota bacterium]